MRDHYEAISDLVRDASTWITVDTCFTVVVKQSPRQRTGYDYETFTDYVFEGHKDGIMSLETEDVDGGTNFIVTGTKRAITRYLGPLAIEEINSRCRSRFAPPRYVCTLCRVPIDVQKRCCLPCDPLCAPCRRRRALITLGVFPSVDWLFSREGLYEWKGYIGTV
jgi:hypothetical protein